MRYASYEIDGRTSWGAVTDAGIVDLAPAFAGTYPDLKSVIAAGFPAEVVEAAGSSATHALDAVTWLSPVPNPDHLWCLAVNYVEHHAEVVGAGRVQELPKKPALFMRWIDTFTGHNTALEAPSVSEQFDYEGELGVIIGKGGRNIAEADALSHVAGYTVINEGSVRDWQFHTKQITPGKNFYHSGGIGPWMVTADEVADPYALSIQTRLNGELLQDGTSADMVHRIEAFIAYASTILPLNPGDILSTGTPSGVGFSRTPPVFMKAGDTVEITIESVGTLTNTVK
ncbi:MAG: fumarylacetoacetate hydrolase family protein [Caulobacteraceae bacterium]|nr:fumarylacetoacetate hydrolase family protein [Caulobacteraceae bacterium]